MSARTAVTAVRSPAAQYDAVVVGAGCAGAATAMLLARRGLHVALVERESVPRDTVSAHALVRAGVMQLHRWGLLDRVIAAGTPAVRRTVFRYGDDTTTVTLKPLAGVDALYAPQRAVLDAILVEAATQAGAEVRLGITVTEVVWGADGRVVGVVGRDRRGQPLRFAARLTIGADGRDSTVASAVDAELERVATHASSFIHAHASGLDTDGYEWFYAPGVTAGLTPTDKGETEVWVGAPQARFRTELAGDLRARFDRLLAEASPDLAQRVASAAPMRGLSSFPGEPGFMRRPWGRGWAVVGDAGAFTDPLTAQGTSAALRDAELLADAGKSFLAGGRSETAAMQEFADARHRLSYPLFAVTEAIASYEWDARSVQVLLRSLSAAMADEVEYLLSLDCPTNHELAG